MEDEIVKIESQNNLKVENKKNKLNVFFLILVVITISILSYLYVSYNFLSKNPTKTTQSSKMCGGVNIVYFLGGNDGDSFVNVIHNGAKAAESDLGANVDYVFSGWDSDKMVAQFTDSIAKSPDAIAIMGHPGASSLGFLIDEAERKNIIVTMQNVDIPSIREKYIDKGFGYAGQDLYSSGAMVANGVIRKYKIKNTEEIVVFGVDMNKDIGRYQRTKGIIDTFKNNNLIVHEIVMPPEVNADAKSTFSNKMFSDAFEKYPNTKVVITDHGPLTTATPAILKAMGKNPGDIIVAGFDLSPETVRGIKSGYIGLVLDQQPYLQGYLPILQACLAKKYSFAGMYINTGVGLIDDSNVGIVEELSDRQIR